MLIKVIKKNGKFELYNMPNDIMPGASCKIFDFKTKVLPKMNELNNYDVSNKIAQFINVVNVNGVDIYYYEIYGV